MLYWTSLGKIICLRVRVMEHQQKWLTQLPSIQSMTSQANLTVLNTDPSLVIVILFSDMTELVSEDTGPGFIGRVRNKLSRALAH